jgi:hypothetical protein
MALVIQFCGFERMLHRFIVTNKKYFGGYLPDQQVTFNIIHPCVLMDTKQ